MSDRSARELAPEGDAAVVEQAVEQVVAEQAVVEQGDASGRLTPPARQDIARQVELAARVRQSRLLPQGLRTRLAEVVESGGSVEDAVRAVEQALPAALRLNEADVARPTHPGGETFFRGDAAEISDEEAETIARGQLTRSGLLRGQRARVAE